MQWRALQSGRIFINQNQDDAGLTLDGLRDRVSREGEQLSPAKSSILNISSKKLSTYQRQALELGLKFAPSPKEEPDLLEFFDQFERRCGWAFKRMTGGTIPTLPKAMLDRIEQMKERLEDL